MTDSSRQRVYNDVKARVIAHELPAGKRILVEALADKLFTSNTPVREALIQLAAERLIKDEPKVGFFTKEISEPEMRDLYVLNQLLLDWSLSITRTDGQVPGMLRPPELLAGMDPSEKISPQKAVQIMNELFVHIAGQSGNADIIHLVKNVNDRTTFIRLKELELFGDSENDLLQLCQTYHRKEIGKLRGELKVYLQMRIELLPDLRRLLRGAYSEIEQPRQKRPNTN